MYSALGNDGEMTLLRNGTEFLALFSEIFARVKVIPWRVPSGEMNLANTMGLHKLTRKDNTLNACRWAKGF